MAHHRDPKGRWARRYPSQRRLHPDHFEPAVWLGPVFWQRDTSRADLAWWQQPPHAMRRTLERDLGPARRIGGRWFGAGRASRILYCTSAVRGPKGTRSHQRRELQWRIAERSQLHRFTSCPF